MKKTSISNTGLLYPTVATLATCVDDEGKANIITLGYSMKTSADPPMVVISIKPSRYSHDLIMKGREFVLSIPTMGMVKALHYCGRRSGRDVDKFEETGFTPIPADQVKPPLIKECPANLECRLVSHFTTGDHTVFVGEVVAAHVNEDAFDDRRECLDLDKVMAIVTHSDEYRATGSVKAYKLNGDIKMP
jgi:flavin reductase (DIM6/NTAB) family NADH-FMN oxidoreductase RutF